MKAWKLIAPKFIAMDPVLDFIENLRRQNLSVRNTQASSASSTLAWAGDAEKPNLSVLEEFLLHGVNMHSPRKITHYTLINDDLLQRINALGAVPAPFTTYAYYNSDKFHFYGEERMKHCMAYRSFFDAGIRAAAGSDFSPGHSHR